MNYFSASNLVIVLINLPIAIILLSTSKGKKPNLYLGFLCLAAVVWGFGSYKYSSTSSYYSAVFWWQIANVGSILSTVVFYYFILSYLGIRRTLMSGVVNALTCFYLFINFVDKHALVGNPRYIFNQFYYLSWPNNEVSLYFLYYFSFFVLLLFYSFFLLINEYVTTFGVRRLQMKYLILGMVIGFIGCHACFLPVFQIKIYPFLNILIAFYTLPIFYSIVKYRLMDIRVVISNTTIFLIIYSFVLGFPLWVGYKKLGAGTWILPTLLMAIFCTIGPYVYLYLQKRAENKILQDQRRYQTTLRQAATGIGRIKQLKKLLNLVVYVLTRAIRLEHALIYLNDELNKKYILNAQKKRYEVINFPNFFLYDSKLTQRLVSNHSPLIVEDEIRRENEALHNSLVDEIKTVRADLILPIYIEDKLLAFIVFGKKESGKSFNEDDLSVFSSLTNQIALAIENAQFYEEVKRTQEQLFQAEKMATIGTMADGLSHQVNNRFHAMGFIAGDALDTIKITKEKGVTEIYRETFDDLERAFNRIQENVVQGGDIVQGLLRYTRKGDAGLTAVDFNSVLKSAFEMAQFKIKTSELKVERRFDENIPKIKGNFTQLQEVFFNLIDNAYDSMMQRKTEKAEVGYQPTLIIHAKQDGDTLFIIVEDNGMGVKDEDREKLFTPFFTTKLSSKKGTGLGLYVIRKIIQENHNGTVEMSSRYMIGTNMKIHLPLFK